WQNVMGLMMWRPNTFHTCTVSQHSVCLQNLTTVCTDAKVQAEFAERFPAVELLTVEGIAGGWEQAMQTQFANGAKLDQLLRR
ncbi:hypothetical protein VC77_15720, partial [Vibrio cholerae]